MTWGYGKIILLGEHAVVYGQPAVAGALGSGIRCDVAPLLPTLHNIYRFHRGMSNCP